MDIKDLISSMSREDFTIFEKRKQEVMKPTQEEIAEKARLEFEMKEKTFNRVMDSYNISINKEETSQQYRKEKLIEYFNLDWDRFAKGLWTKDCYADLRVVVDTISKSHDAYRQFVGIVYTFDSHFILDNIL